MLVDQTQALALSWRQKIDSGHHAPRSVRRSWNASKRRLGRFVYFPEHERSATLRPRALL